MTEVKKSSFPAVAAMLARPFSSKVPEGIVNEAQKRLTDAIEVAKKRPGIFVCDAASERLGNIMSSEKSGPDLQLAALKKRTYDDVTTFITNVAAAANLFGKPKYPKELGALQALANELTGGSYAKWTREVKDLGREVSYADFCTIAKNDEENLTRAKDLLSELRNTLGDAEIVNILGRFQNSK
ncbi:MAG: hypothetical protein NT157_03085 [Candidatus Micrarchaeota archaeon]|nr:hypothetical protein [Candidatus Micrarchaeota archaeon]